MNREKRISKNDIKTAKRLLKYVTETYKFRFVLVFICILISAVASISVSLSLKFMLDDYIIPLIGQQNPNYTELYHGAWCAGMHFHRRSAGDIHIHKIDGLYRSGRVKTCP